MFNDLSAKIEGAFKRLAGRGVINEKNIQEALREIRMALLEADVNFKVVKDFIDKATAKALGQEVLRSVSPGDQLVKIVYDELVETLGHEHAPLKHAGIPPTVVMVVGLQGSGKTTFSGKLANYLRKKGRKPMLVAADVYRPAAADQLRTLGKTLDIPTFSPDEAGSHDPVKICFDAVTYARQHGRDLIVLDTAGRLHIDDALMTELEQIKIKTQPNEILFVADGMTGQDAVNTAAEFVKRLDFDGVVLTKLDGDARGGAALSIRRITGKPIKFIGTGEKMDALEEFYPDRMASRILGMGDIVSLVEKAQETIDQEQAQKMHEKMMKNEFTLADFSTQLGQIKKLGSLESILSMIPGVGSKIKGMQMDDKVLVRMEAIISSMTPKERERPQMLDGRRRLRIARGSGTSVQEVNRLLKQFDDMKRMMKKIGKMNPAEVMNMMSQMGR
ncbi:MAG TPA: signal recognition particle protein [bacterium]|nr:signal recognition particle protein [bacterium]HNE83966.1 signal recognition particle protein [bacterium]